MHYLSTLIFLSTPSILLIISPAQGEEPRLQWPYNLPAHVKYYPQDEPIVRRSYDVQRRLAEGNPLGVKKMSGDEGEMFWIDFWEFGDKGNTLAIGAASQRRDEWDDAGESGASARKHVEDDWRGNCTTIPQLQPAFTLHSDRQITAVQRYFRRQLEKRDFTCPAGTTSCTGISRPNSCCSTGQTCSIITDTGLGDVGCCGSGSTCGGQVASCPQSYTPCQASQGGGCCIPGYQCSGVGCVLISTSTVVIIPVGTAARPTSFSSPSSNTPTASTALTVATTSASSITTTTTTTTKSSSSPPPTTSSPVPIIPVALTCSSAFQSCPESLGGGCCPSTRLCGPADCPALSPSTTSTPNPVSAAVRPTSNAEIITTISSIPTPSSCPTGYYQCSAYYNGGACCQVGRDCGLTSCPPHISSTALVSEGVTVVVAPTGNAAATTTAAAAPEKGVCATGWFSCGADVGGGCCPSGYGCGVVNCAAGASETATGTVGKGAVSVAARVMMDGREMVMGTIAGLLLALISL